MPRRLSLPRVVLAGAIVLVIVAIAVVAAKWPRLPARTLPAPPKYVACLASITSDMRVHPDREVRIDEQAASISITPTGASWRDDAGPHLQLTPDEHAQLLAAFELDCAPSNAGSIAVTYNGVTARLDPRSPAAARIGALFDAIRARVRR